MPPNDSQAASIVILGVTGDLAARKLMPALYELHLMGALPKEARFVGVSRQKLSEEDLRQRMKEALQTHSAKSFDEAAWQELEPRFSYVQGNYDEVDTYRRLAAHLAGLDEEGTGGNRVFYFSTPPSVFEGIIRSLREVGLNRSSGWTRVVIEKPFGRDLESARELNRILEASFEEDQIYRIDHYLGKETAQNIAVLRFANAFFEPIWSNRYIDHVQITVSEDLGTEGRGGFYEEAGVLRDIIQNHVLQLVALIAIEAPARYDARSVRDEKVKVLRAMRCLGPDRTVKGQYVAGDGMKAYREEEGVNPNSKQGTYLALELRIDTWRWAGVPFFVRSGKRLAAKASEIVLQLKTPPHIPFSFDAPTKPDTLTLRITPDEGISLRFNAKAPGQSLKVQQTSLDFTYDQGFKRSTPDAYETLLLDVMRGDATLFMRADEIEEQWKVVSPLLEVWDEQRPKFYEAGTWGPEEADGLLGGRSWQVPGSEQA